MVSIYHGYSIELAVRFNKKCQLITVLLKYTLEKCARKKASSKGAGLIFWRLVATGTRQQADRIVCFKSR